MSAILEDRRVFVPERNAYVTIPAGTDEDEANKSLVEFSRQTTGVDQPYPQTMGVDQPTEQQPGPAWYSPTEALKGLGRGAVGAAGELAASEVMLSKLSPYLSRMVGTNTPEGLREKLATVGRITGEIQQGPLLGSAEPTFIGDVLGSVPGFLKYAALGPGGVPIAGAGDYASRLAAGEQEAGKSALIDTAVGAAAFPLYGVGGRLAATAMKPAERWIGSLLAGRAAQATGLGSMGGAQALAEAGLGTRPMPTLRELLVGVAGGALVPGAPRPYGAPKLIPPIEARPSGFVVEKPTVTDTGPLRINIREEAKSKLATVEAEMDIINKLSAGTEGPADIEIINRLKTLELRQAQLRKLAEGDKVTVTGGKDVEAIRRARELEDLPLTPEMVGKVVELRPVNHEDFQRQLEPVVGTEKAAVLSALSENTLDYYKNERPETTQEEWYQGRLIKPGTPAAEIARLRSQEIELLKAAEEAKSDEEYQYIQHDLGKVRLALAGIEKGGEPYATQEGKRPEDYQREYQDRDLARQAEEAGRGYRAGAVAEEGEVREPPLFARFIFGGEPTPERIKAFAAGTVQAQEGSPLQSPGPLGAFDQATRVMHIFASSNHSTFFHEYGHAVVDILSPVDYQTSSRFVGAEPRAWSGVHHEKFADALSNYFMRGKSPNEAMKGVFARAKQWLSGVYNGLRRRDIDIPLSKEMIDVFDRLTGGQARIEEVISRAETTLGHKIERRPEFWKVNARDLRKAAAFYTKETTPEKTLERGSWLRKKADAAEHKDPVTAATLRRVANDLYSSLEAHTTGLLGELGIVVPRLPDGRIDFTDPNAAALAAKIEEQLTGQRHEAWETLRKTGEGEYTALDPEFLAEFQTRMAGAVNENMKDPGQQKDAAAKIQSILERVARSRNSANLERRVELEDRRVSADLDAARYNKKLANRDIKKSKINSPEWIDATSRTAEQDAIIRNIESRRKGLAKALARAPVPGESTTALDLLKMMDIQHKPAEELGNMLAEIYGAKQVEGKGIIGLTKPELKEATGRIARVFIGLSNSTETDMSATWGVLLEEITHASVAIMRGTDIYNTAKPLIDGLISTGKLPRRMKKPGEREELLGNSILAYMATKEVPVGQEGLIPVFEWVSKILNEEWQLAKHWGVKDHNRYLLTGLPTRPEMTELAGKLIGFDPFKLDNVVHDRPITDPIALPAKIVTDLKKLQQLEREGAEAIRKGTAPKRVGPVQVRKAGPVGNILAGMEARGEMPPRIVESRAETVSGSQMIRRTPELIGPLVEKYSKEKHYTTSEELALHDYPIDLMNQNIKAAMDAAQKGGDAVSKEAVLERVRDWLDFKDATYFRLYGAGLGPMSRAGRALQAAQDSAFYTYTQNMSRLSRILNKERVLGPKKTLTDKQMAALKEAIDTSLGSDEEAFARAVANMPHPGLVGSTWNTIMDIVYTLFYSGTLSSIGLIQQNVITAEGYRLMKIGRQYNKALVDIPYTGVMRFFESQGFKKVPVLGRYLFRDTRYEKQYYMAEANAMLGSHIRTLGGLRNRIWGEVWNVMKTGRDPKLRERYDPTISWAVDLARRGSYLENSPKWWVRMIAPAVNVGPRLMVAGDVIIGSGAFADKAASMAARYAASKGLRGEEFKTAMKQRLSEYLEPAGKRSAEVEEEVEIIRVFAADAIFRNAPDVVAQHVLQIRNAAGPLGLVYAPYVITTWNMSKRVVEMTPISSQLVTLGKIYASRKGYDVKVSGIDEAVKWIESAGFVAAAALLYKAGMITGSPDPDKRYRDIDEGARKPPWSILINGHWVRMKEIMGILSLPLFATVDAYRWLDRSIYNSRRRARAAELAAKFKAAPGGLQFTDTIPSFSDSLPPVDLEDIETFEPYANAIQGIIASTRDNIMSGMWMNKFGDIMQYEPSDVGVSDKLTRPFTDMPSAIIPWGSANRNVNDAIESWHKGYISKKLYMGPGEKFIQNLPLGTTLFGQARSKRGWAGKEIVASEGGPIRQLSVIKWSDARVDDPVENELQRLQKTTLHPYYPTPPLDVLPDGTEIEDKDRYEKYAIETGEAMHKAMASEINSPDYRRLVDDDVKMETLRRVWNIAKLIERKKLEAELNRRQ